MEDKSNSPDVGSSVASTMAPARGTLGISMVSSSIYLPSSSDLDGFDTLTVDKLNSQNLAFTKENSDLAGYPRIITPMQLLEESDDESTWCGPPSEPEDSGKSEIRALEAWGINQDHGKGRREGGAHTAVIAAAAAAAAEGKTLSNSRVENSDVSRDRLVAEKEGKKRNDDRAKREPGQAQSRRPPPLIQPRGDVDGDNQKFVCVFLIGLDDDEEFCLVKRILGKAGNNMRRIAEECSAKVRLRGIGSGFLEGADGREANMPLQLNISCSDFDSYQGAVDRVSTLLKDLYKHYRRYARSKGMEPPDVKVTVEEVRRDDLSLDILQQKAQRSPSQRERDRKAREKERQTLREKEREKEERSGLREGNLVGSSQIRKRSRDRDTESVVSQVPLTLPGGAPIPTTPAGRRLAAKAGGAEHAAIVSAAAREQEKMERDRVRRDRDELREKEKQERDVKKKEAANRAAAFASRMGRNATRPTPSSTNYGSPAKDYEYTSPAKNAESLDGTWSSWKGTATNGGTESNKNESNYTEYGNDKTWEEWDPWAAAAGKGRNGDKEESKGGGKSDPWASKGSSKGKGKENGKSKPKPTPAMTEAANRALAAVGKARR